MVMVMVVAGHGESGVTMITQLIRGTLEIQSLDCGLWIFFENFKNFNTVQSSVNGSFQLLRGQTWGQGLLQLLCLLFVCDDQSVKVSAASKFQLHIILIFLDLDRLGILCQAMSRKSLISSILPGIAMRRGARGRSIEG